MEVSVTKFKARLLGIVEKIQRENCQVIISRHGKPAAQLIPIDSKKESKLFGRSAEQAEINGDLLRTGEVWDTED